MARIDKYKIGFRAPIAADRAASATPIGVGLDTNGKVVAGSGTTGILGILMDNQARKAGDIVDVMVDGELVEFSGDAGSAYWADATDGTLEAAATGDFYVGASVEATRLIVRVIPGVTKAGA